MSNIICYNKLNEISFRDLKNDGLTSAFGGAFMKKHRRKTSLICSLTVLFIILKLIGVISWPWVWVLFPAWFALVIAVLVFSFILVGGRLKKGKW